MKNITINESTRTLITELMERYGMHWLTRDDYGSVEAHMDMPRKEDGEWMSDDVTGVGCQFMLLGYDAIETIIDDRELGIDAHDVDLAFVDGDEPIYIDELLADDGRNARNMALSRRVAELVSDMGDDPEEADEAVRVLYNRLNAERDDFFHGIIETLADTLDNYMD